MSFWRFVGGFAIFSRVWDLILGSRKRRVAGDRRGNNAAYRAGYHDAMARNRDYSYDGDTYEGEDNHDNDPYDDRYDDFNDVNDLDDLETDSGYDDWSNFSDEMEDVRDEIDDYRDEYGDDWRDDYD